MGNNGVSVAIISKTQGIYSKSSNNTKFANPTTTTEILGNSVAIDAHNSRLNAAEEKEEENNAEGGHQDNNLAREISTSRGSILIKTDAPCEIERVLGGTKGLLRRPLTFMNLRQIVHLVPSVVGLGIYSVSDQCDSGWRITEEKSDQSPTMQYKITFKKTKRFISKAKIRKWTQELHKALVTIVLDKHESFLLTRAEDDLPKYGSLHPEFDIANVMAISPSRFDWPEIAVCELPKQDPLLPIGCDDGKEEAGNIAAASKRSLSSSSSSSVFKLEDTPLLPRRSSALLPSSSSSSSSSSSAPQKPSVAAFLEYIRSLPFYKDQIVETKRIPAKRPRFGMTALTPQMQQVLKQKHDLLSLSQAYNYNRMYTHQASAIKHIRRGEHVVIATSTSSGKSLVYNVCSLAAILADPTATVLYIFPTKALAQDQLGSLKRLIKVLNRDTGACIRCETLDGDSPFETREVCRNSKSYPNIILTNPDMLHVSILPRHEQYSGILENLRFVVLDEAHLYRGCFGSHVSLVIRRLRRIIGIHKQAKCLRNGGTRRDPVEEPCEMEGIDCVGEIKKGASDVAIATTTTNTTTTTTSSSISGNQDSSSSSSSSSHHNEGTTTNNNNATTPRPPPSFWGSAAGCATTTSSTEKSMQFIACSATIANPKEHLMAITGFGRGECTVIDNDGSPSGEKTFLFWNPPLKGGKPSSSLPRRGDQHTLLLSSSRAGSNHRHKVNRMRRLKIRNSNARRSPHMETAMLLAQLVRFGFKTITFCKVRKVCEIVLDRTHELLRNSARPQDLDNVPRVKSYRAGYRLEQRRKIERQLFSNQLCGVVATSALELGIDVGSLDASLHLGFPGSISSFHQQAGRCGRTKGDSVSIMIAYSSPLDQFITNHPHETVFHKTYAHAVIDPWNFFILRVREPTDGVVNE
eukprot:jgi/Bigna1/66503/fgenesh1_pg.1_\